MSLAIDPSKVTAVILATGRYEVKPRSFDCDSYEFVVPDVDPRRNGFIVHGGGQSGVCATGFEFVSAATGNRVCGPLTAILAVEEEV